MREIFIYSSLAIAFLAPAKAEPPNFADHVLPIFKENCLSCHDEGKKKGGLVLSSLEKVLEGSSGGQVVKPGVADSSVLLMAIRHEEGVKAMPEDEAKLSDANIKVISDWIDGGLLNVAGGKSLLREVDSDVELVGGVRRPADPAFPKNLPPLSEAEIVRPLPVMALASSPWANLFAVNGYERIDLYGVGERESEYRHLGALPFPEDEIHDLRFSRDGELLVAAGGVGSESGYAVVFEVRTGKRIARLGDEKDVALSADISANNQFVAIGTPKKMVKIMSVQDGRVLHEIKKHTDWVTRVRFSPDGKWLATGDRNGGIHIWETKTGGIVYTLAEHKMAITALGWRPDGKMLVSGAEDGKMILWDMKDGFPVRSANTHALKSESRFTRHTGVLDIAMSGEGIFLTTGRDRTLKRWKPDGGGHGAINDLENLPTRLVLSQEGQAAITGDSNGKLTVWDLKTLKSIQKLP